ncbi:hypothetical protein [Nodosilinea sp. P-1105]|uniref:hypothetical protein n=1 Tax=Nodosilinea sp. P-1105 TaxID=2546229 RepID=UPI00146E0B7D|nr:hypothetical protein [Nodosilinea sp. P-1105]NMF84654.1 hypothetical protein [Nodosilinea sp. P-1105]
MTTDRLDRIEAILANLAESQAVADQRLSRTEALQALTQQQIESTQQQIESTQRQIDSNARSIAAWENRFTEIEEETQEATSSTRQELAERLSTLASVMDGLVRERRAERIDDRQRWEENNQRFNNLLEEARADRQVMEHFIQTSTENIQTLFAEVSRIWQRLAS